MTYRPDPSRPLLPGPAGSRAEVATPPPVKPHRGILHLAAFVVGSVRAQKGLTLFLVLGSMLTGVGLLWLATPRWHVNTAVHSSPSIAAGEHSPSLLASISANDLARVLDSPSLHVAVENELADLIQQINARSETRSVRNRARAFWGRTRRLPERLVASTPSELADDAPLRVEPFVVDVTRARDDSENIVGLRVRAVDPELARRVAVLLVEQARTQLTASEHERATDRLREMTPELNDASSKLVTVESEIAAFQLESGKQDPGAWARNAQEQLALVRADRAELETDYAEAKARQLGVESKLTQVEREHVGRIVTKENPRMIELDREIDDLESTYASQLTRMTGKHPRMVELRQQIESKKEARSRLKRLVIHETVTEPDPRFERLLNDKIQIDQLIVELTGRELGLARTEAILADELNKASTLVNEMGGLNRRREMALARFDSLSEESLRLTAVKNNRTLFAHVRLVDREPVVKHPDRPDEPNVVQHLGLTSLCALFLGLIVPTIRAAGRRRLVADWQIDELTHLTAVRVAGALPDASPHRLLKRGSGGSTS